MSRPYLNLGPGFLRWLAGLLMLFILMSLVVIQWRGFSDDDDSADVASDDDSSDDDDSAR